MNDSSTNEAIPLRQQKIELLEFFAKHVILGMIDLHIIINVNGLCISGQLISAKQYYKELSNLAIPETDLGEKKGNKIRESYENFFAKVGATVPETEGELEKYDVKYIYLKDARFYSGFRTFPINSGTYWMGRRCA